MSDEKKLQAQQYPPGYQATSTSPPYVDQKLGCAPEQQAYPTQQPGYPTQQPSYPPQQPGYPPQQTGYPPQQPAYPPAYSGTQPGMIQPSSAPAFYAQQPGMVVVPNTIFLADRSYLNFTGAIILSCVVYWCCGWIFGLISFTLAMIGQSSASSGDSTSARNLLTASYVVSVIGMVIGIIIIIIIIIFTTTAATNFQSDIYKEMHKQNTDWSRNNFK